MNKFTKEMTQDWWVNLLKDTPRFNAWLQKLYKTELGGYTDHMKFLGQHGAEVPERTALILTNIALDELKHANIIHGLLNDRGVDLGDPPESSYWKIINQDVKSVSDYCAVNHYGEAIAAFRFSVIRDMKETPSDIKNALDIVLPDEEFHRVTLNRLAGEESLARMLESHQKALASI